jgi:hypothetical protein
MLIKILKKERSKETGEIDFVEVGKFNTYNVRLGKQTVYSNDGQLQTADLKLATSKHLDTDLFYSIGKDVFFIMSDIKGMSRYNNYMFKKYRKE